MAVALSFLLALGCSCSERRLNTKVGILSIDTNALVTAIPPGTHQGQVETRVGMPYLRWDTGVWFYAETQSTGAMIKVPVGLWRYACTDGTMDVAFDTNKVIIRVNSVNTNDISVEI